MGYNKKTENQDIVLKNILFVLRKNVFLIIAITLLFIAGGAVYVQFQKPVYTAKEAVIYHMDVEEEGNSSNSNVVSEMSAMTIYFNSLREFCISGIVLDRANAYINEYYDSFEADTSLDVSPIDQFIQKVRLDYEDGKTEVNYSNIRTLYFTKSNCNYKAVDEQTMQFTFYLLTSNENSEVANDMIRILALSADLEAKYSFGGVTTYISEFSTNDVSVSSSVSLKKSMVIFGFLGVVSSLVFVYVKRLLNNTLVDEREVELITGKKMLTYIDKEGI